MDINADEPGSPTVRMMVTGNPVKEPPATRPSLPLTGVTVGLLVLYDMLKAVSHGMTLGPTRLLRKEGGRRGTITLPWEGCPWKP